MAEAERIPSLKVCFVLILVLGFVLPVAAVESVRIADTPGSRSISVNSEYFLDTSKVKTFETIQLLPDSDFTAQTQDHYSLGLVKDIVWIRFRLDKTGTETSLLSVTKLFSYMDVYLPRKSDAGVVYNILNSGYFTNSPERTFPYRYPVMELPDDFASGEYVYVRIQPFSPHDHMSADFSVMVETVPRFYTKAVIEIALYIFLLGGLVVLCIYNLFLAISLRSPLYTIYIGYLACIMTYVSLRSRIPAIFGLYDVHVLVLPSIALAYGLAIYFSRSFLETRKYLPKTDLLLKGTIGVCALVLFSSATGYPVLANRLLHFLAIGAPVVFVAAGTTRLKQGYIPSRFYLFAWIIWGSASVIVGTGGMGLVSSPLQLELAIGIGSVAEALLMSLALADRINVLRSEKNELETREKKLTEITLRDELTGLFNQRKYKHSIRESIQLCRDAGAPLSLMILDIDHFKRVNDDYGHLVGDEVLKNLASAIIGEIRSNDLAFRYGGEEFAVILRDTALSDAMEIAQRLNRRFAETSYVLGDLTRICKTVSIGVTELCLDDDAECLFNRADRYLYLAKAAGRNRIICGEESTVESLQEA